MAKITVRHAVAAAYGLLFGRPLTVLGLTWLPAAFYAIGTTLLIKRMDVAITAAIPAASRWPGQFGFFFYLAALVAATALFGSLIAVSLTRQAFGLREEKVAAHLVFGARELRLFLALLRYYAIVVGGVVVLALGAGIAISQVTRYASQQGTTLGFPLESWLNSIGGTIAALVALGFVVRYGFFLDAIAGVEDHARLSRARSLSQGNFFSLSMITFLVGVPAAVLLVSSEMTFGGLGIAQSGFASANALPFAAILTFGLVILHTLFAGASAGAYAELAEAVVHEPEPASVENTYEPAGAVVAAPVEETHRPWDDLVAVAAAEPARTMEVATPEAEGATNASTTMNWMAPPPDSHFGADPHDAQHHDAQADDRPAAGPVQIAVEHSVERQIDSAVSELAAIAGVTSESSAGARADDATTQVVGFDGHPTEMPDHAHNAEFPPPPLDPAGVIAAQQGLHPPA